jgi:hypothetical protein
MLKTRTLIFAAAISLTASLALANTATAGGPVGCNTKVCGPEAPPEPRNCKTVQTELDAVNLQLWGYGTGLHFSVSITTYFRDVWADRLMYATVASVQAQQTLAAVIANAPAYADVPMASPNPGGSTGLVLTLDRQALWEQELAAAQAEVTRTGQAEANASTQLNNYSSALPGVIAARDAAVARALALEAELKTCTYRG